MDANNTKRKRVLTDVSNKVKGNNASIKKKCIEPSVPSTRVTRKSSRIKKAAAEEILLPSIEKLTVNKEESMIVEECDDEICIKEEVVEMKVEEIPEKEPDWINVDADLNCIFFLTEYANNVFQYYKDRESLFKVGDYLSTGRSEVTMDMRAVLVDWLVDVQQNFELNHESLYSTVKMFDLYVSRTHVPKNHVQLAGAVALSLSCKYDERCPPPIDDFLYVCDDAYTRREFLDMEVTMLRVLGFDLGLPLSYTFLRRYSQCARTTSQTLTLARYILEMSLMYYQFVAESESVMACAALFMAMAMTGDGSWDGTVLHYTGRRPESFINVVVSLNKILSSPIIMNAKSIRSKYSHRVFLEVARIPLLSDTKLIELSEISV